jgi:nitrogen fixation protein NifX
MLAAFATTDGKIVNQHFGHTLCFLIMEIDEESFEWKPAGRRETLPACSYGTHDEAALRQSIGLISDCGAMFAARIGPYAKNALDRRGIQPLEITGFIDDVLAGYVRYLKKQRQRRGNHDVQL